MKNSHHVVPSSHGGWNVKKAGAERASRHFDRQSEAIDWARGVSQNQSTELYIHRRDGSIREKDSHGHDPHPPRG